MSACVVLVPVLISTWPMFAAAVASASAAAGFSMVNKQPKKIGKVLNSTEITMENMEVVAESLSHDKEIVVEKDGVRVKFSRDARGFFKTCVEGDLPRQELEKIGRELGGLVIQNYVHRRLMHELENQGFITLNEEQTADNSIHVHVRKM